MNILILTGKFGMGHVSAANAIKQDINHDLKGVNVTSIDIIEYLLPKLHKQLYKGFNLIAEKYHNLYNLVYNTSEKNSEKNYELSIDVFFMKKIHNLIEETKPDIVISTLSICSKFISSYKKRYNNNLPLLTCITDVCSSNEWLTKETNMYFVATNSVKVELVSKGILPENIIISGIPVKRQFKENYKKENQTSKQKQLLLMGGGIGLLPTDLNFYNNINNIPNTKTTVITGKNTSLYEKLHNKYENIEVIGFTTEVHKYMQNSDVIISKAGGITLFETILSDLPILVPCPFLAQEINNAHFIENEGIGKIIWDDSKDIASVVNDFLSNELEQKRIKNNMRRIKEKLINNPIPYAINQMELKEMI